LAGWSEAMLIWAASGCSRCGGRVVAGRSAQPPLACIDSPRLPLTLTPAPTMPIRFPHADGLVAVPTYESISQNPDGSAGPWPVMVDQTMQPTQASLWLRPSRSASQDQRGAGVSRARLVADGTSRPSHRFRSLRLGHSPGFAVPARPIGGRSLLGGVLSALEAVTFGAISEQLVLPVMPSCHRKNDQEGPGGQAGKPRSPNRVLDRGCPQATALVGAGSGTTSRPMPALNNRWVRAPMAGHCPGWNSMPTV